MTTMTIPTETGPQGHLRGDNAVPDMTLDQVLWECFRHFAHDDEANAAIHCARTRYSPLTFRLADALDRYVTPDVRGFLTADGAALLNRVLSHRGAYTEDKGR
jgi:hypothetical protein